MFRGLVEETIVRFRREMYYEDNGERYPVTILGAAIDAVAERVATKRDAQKLLCELIEIFDEFEDDDGGGRKTFLAFARSIAPELIAAYLKQNAPEMVVEEARRRETAPLA